jgi:SpoVK/Ycf46/Vps4 family AAA+-type ATPase
MQIDELPSYTVVAAATNHPELLDRAAWRRFQIRLSLPLPTQKSLALYIETFSKRLGESLGQPAATIAKRLGRISYAEAEDFCLDLRRSKILSATDKNLKTIVNEQLDIWSEQARAAASSSDRGDDGKAAACSNAATLQSISLTHGFRQTCIGRL